MLNIVDIKKAITGIIKKRYPKAKVYFDNIDKCETPYFYVEFTAINHVTLDEFSSDRTIQIDIMYCPAAKRECDRNLLFIMCDEIDRLLRPVFHVADRYLTLQDVEMKIHDDILHYIFNLDFADTFEEEETHELMRTLEMDWR